MDGAIRVLLVPPLHLRAGFLLGFGVPVGSGLGDLVDNVGVYLLLHPDVLSDPELLDVGLADRIRDETKSLRRGLGRPYFNRLAPVGIRGVALLSVFDAGNCVTHGLGYEGSRRFPKAAMRQCIGSLKSLFEELPCRADYVQSVLDLLVDVTLGRLESSYAGDHVAEPDPRADVDGRPRYSRRATFRNGSRGVAEHLRRLLMHPPLAVRVAPEALADYVNRIFDVLREGQPVSTSASGQQRPSEGFRR